MSLIGFRTTIWNWVYKAWTGRHTPPDMALWTTPDPSDRARFDAVVCERAGVWMSMSSFFAGHGYSLYDLQRECQDHTLRPPILPRPCYGSSEEAHPWPRRLWKDEHDLEFADLRGCRMWPARSCCGREVMIRAVSGPAVCEELRIYRKLNTKSTRADPRNHTLPVLDYLTLDGVVFVVLPRWHCALECDSDAMPFKSASEILYMAEMSYEGLQFLHENRISHGDIAEGNMVMNVLLGRGSYGVSDMRAPDTVGYAYIDWDAARMFANGTDIASVRVHRDMRNPALLLGLPEGLCNPFKDDVRCLTNVLQKWVRVLEDDIPELGEFFDRILACDDNHLPSAQDCLDVLRQIRSGVTPSELAQPPKFVFWCNGYLKPMCHPYIEDILLEG